MGVTAHGNMIMYRGIRGNVIASALYQFNLFHPIISNFYLRNTFAGLFDRIYCVITMFSLVELFCIWLTASASPLTMHMYSLNDATEMTTTMTRLFR